MTSPILVPFLLPVQPCTQNLSFAMLLNSEAIYFDSEKPLFILTSVNVGDYYLAAY
jgi:hypothetical protein